MQKLLRRAWIADPCGIAPETLFVPMHWGTLWTDNGEANLLTHSEACPISLQPELKACAVQLVPINQQQLSTG